MNDDTPPDNWTGAPDPETPSPAAPSGAAPRSPLLRRRAAGIAAITGLGIGGLIGGYVISHAATTVATATPSPSSGAPEYGGRHADIPGGRDEDLQVAASAIGISASDLQTALQNGQTIAAVAKAHNVDLNQVVSALVASEDKEIDSALASGSITSAQATQMKAGVQQRVTDMVNGTMPPGGHDGRGGPGGPHGLQGEDLTLVAGVIGISSSDLQTALQNGQTIAAVAKAHNVDASKVISAWVASENKEIDDRASSGQITSAQATRMKAMTQQRVTDEVNGTFHGGPGGPGGPGFGGPRGAGDGGGFGGGGSA